MFKQAKMYMFMLTFTLTIKRSFQGQDPLKRMTEFLNEKYPKLSSLLELDIEKQNESIYFG